MKNVYYPLAGMNYVIDDIAQIVENKMEDKGEVHLWLSAQVNCFPHIGTLTNFISAFALAKHLKAYYNKAAMLMGMGDYLEASKTFFQLIKRNPDYYKAYLGIAMSFDKMSKYKDAIRYYKKFLELKQFSEDSVFAKNRVNELRNEYFSKENNLRLV